MVLAVVEGLLELMPIACRLPGRAPRDCRKHVGRHVVQRPALEAAVAVEHDHRLVAGGLRNVRTGCETRLMVHEVVARPHRELEHILGPLAVILRRCAERVGKVAKRARIRASVTHRNRVVERFCLRQVCILNVIRIGPLRRAKRDLVAAFHCPRQRLRHTRLAILGIGRQHGIVVMIERPVRIDRWRQRFRIVLDRPAIRKLKLVVDAVGKAAYGTRQKAKAATRHAVECPVEREERSRVVIKREASRRREIGRVAAARRNAKAVALPLEEYAARRRNGIVAGQPRPFEGCAEVELHGNRAVVGIPDRLVGNIHDFETIQRHFADLAPGKVDRRHVPRFPRNRQMAPDTIRNLDIKRLFEKIRLIVAHQE